jgi:hypothetical protein
MTGMKMKLVRCAQVIESTFGRVMQPAGSTTFVRKTPGIRADGYIADVKEWL